MRPTRSRALDHIQQVVYVCPRSAETATPRPSPLRLLDPVRDNVRLLYYFTRIEEAYVGWIRKFILFHGKRHPETMHAPSAAMHPAGWRQTDSLIRWSLFPLPLRISRLPTPY